MIPKLSKMIHKLSESCPKFVKKTSQNCPKFVPKLSPNCSQIMPNLSPNGPQILYFFEEIEYLFAYSCNCSGYPWLVFDEKLMCFEELWQNCRHSDKIQKISYLEQGLTFL